MKKFISVVLSVLLGISCFTAFSAGEDEISLFSEDFDNASSNLSYGGMSAVVRPENGSAVYMPYTPNGSQNGALLSDPDSTVYTTLKFDHTYTGNVIYETDFRLEAPVEDATKLKISALYTNTVAALVTLSSANTEDYKVRFAGRTEQGEQNLAVSKKKLSYQTWHTLRLELHTGTGTFDCYVNDELVGEGLYPWTAGAFNTGVKKVSFYNSAQSEASFLIDNVRIKNEFCVKSAAYTVEQDRIYGVQAGTGVADFLSNLTVPDETTVTLYSDYGTKTPRADFVADGDFLEIVHNRTADTRVYTVKLFTHAFTYYVSTLGSDDNTGTTPSSAFATLARAKNAVQQAKQTADGAYSVKILAGDYTFTQPVVFTEADSGTAQNPVTYEAYGNGTVTFKGAVTLDGETATPVTDTSVLNKVIDVAARNKLMEIDLAAAGVSIPDMPDVFGYSRGGYSPLRVYINGKALTEARYPNTGFIDVTGTDGVKSPVNITYSEDVSHAALWSDALTRGDFYIAGLIAQAYAANHLRVASFDPVNKNIVTVTGGAYAPSADRSKFYFANLLEEIDVPGESYIDTAAGKIYFYPYEGMEDATVEIGVLDTPMLTLSGTSHIGFKNLHFEYTRNKIIDAQAVDELTINACTFAHTGANALTLNGTSITLQNSHIYDLAGMAGTGGVQLSGGDRANLVSANNRIVNNKLHDFDRVYEVSQAPAIMLTGCVGTRIENNEIYNGTAYVIRVVASNDIQINRNEIHDSVTMSSDAGAVTWGRDISLLGFEVKENYFHHNGKMLNPHGQNSLFHDDGSAGPYAYGNIFYKATPDLDGAGYSSIRANGGQYGVWENNIFIEGNRAGHFSSWSTGRAGTDVQDRWWMSILSVYEPIANRNTVWWDRLQNTPFFSNTWKAHYAGTQWAPLWDIFGEEIYEEANALYAAGDTTKYGYQNADLLNYAKQYAPSKTNVLNNNVVIGISDTVAFGGNYRDTNTYQIESGENLFQDYGKDFTLTADGLAQIQANLPDFRPIDFSAIGLQPYMDNGVEKTVGSSAGLPSLIFSDADLAETTLSYAVRNPSDRAASGFIVCAAYMGDALAFIRLEPLVLGGEQTVNKTVAVTQPYDRIELFAFKNLTSMKVISNMVKQTR